MWFCIICHGINNINALYNFLIDTGSGFGLQLTLNIEQYEYIKGPNTDAGIKVGF